MPADPCEIALLVGVRGPIAGRLRRPERLQVGHSPLSGNEAAVEIQHGNVVVLRQADRQPPAVTHHGCDQRAAISGGSRDDGVLAARAAGEQDGAIHAFPAQVVA